MMMRMTCRTTSAIAAIFFMATVFFANDAAARVHEYPYLYKSPRAMGMGGAGVAVGGRFDSVFMNPAGLGLMPKDNWEFNLLNINVEVSDNAIDFVNDMVDAFDTGDLDGDGQTDDDEMRAVNNVLAKYFGTNMHVGLSSLTSLARTGERIGFGVGALGTVNLNAVPHQGFGSDGLLEVDASAKYGAVSALSVKANDNLYMGLGVKALNKESLQHNFTARELTEYESNLEDYIVDDLRTNGSGLGFDAGVIYRFAFAPALKPALGFSVLNIGKMNYGEAGSDPMTCNIGASISPEVGFVNSITIGADYVDMLNAIDTDSDIGKRIRLGGEVVVWDALASTLALRAGLYQGYPTYGVDFRFTMIDVAYTTYAEEVGAYAGQDKDRRHMITLGIGW